MEKKQMETNNISINRIKILKFRDILLWDVKRYLGNSLISKEGYITLKSILTPYRKKIQPQEVVSKKYQIISKINFSGKLFLREFEEINSYKGNLFLVPQNAIIFSKINARHGCIYFHQEEKSFVVSNEYPVFIVDLTKVDGEYLKQYLRSSRLKEHLNSRTTGISKARIKSDEFLSVPFPLKPIAIQEKIINTYKIKNFEVTNLLQKLKNKEEQIEQTINKLLCINLPSFQVKKKGIYFSNYSEITRWDFWVNEAIGQSDKYRNGIFQEVIIGNPMYGANVKSVDIKSDTRYIRITDINEDGTLNDDFVSAEKVEEKYLLKNNDFLIARSGNTVGKTFLYKDENGKALFAGYLVKYELNLNKVIPDYVFYYTKSRLFKNWIKVNQRVAGQPNINGQEYLYSPIILPPISVQEEIVREVRKMKDEYQSIKSKADFVQKEALKEFEQAIFKN